MRKKTGKKTGEGVKKTGNAPLYYRLHALLETIRTIKEYEDPLCSLLHTIKTAGTASPEVEGELEDLLDAMPSYAYAEELVAVRDLLGARSPDPQVGQPERAAAPRQRAARTA